MMQILSLYNFVFKCSAVLVSASDLFSQCLLYKSIFLVLLLCRAVTQKVYEAETC